ncbi:MAG: FapA family protein [Spirochaetales bacterium]|uniref:FapA family protein n=1 Tax=Candidatus Thalassospirochaeta sargassi TaxID=3119039 RepID=A0AAJ1MIE7_9SPIO|nr:FapA family protein [Spirochaetales bacterium]
MADENKVKGRVEINTDDEGLLAVLHFIPDDNADEWDLQKINRYIAEKQITFGIKKDELSLKLEGLFASPEEITITVAEGEPPEAPVAAEREWAAVEIPEKVKEDVERFLKNAPPPEIFKTEVEKITKEKTVKKKGFLPFGKEKEEKVSEIVKREKKLRVDVIPEVIEAGWVEAGLKIADVKAGKPGKPGKDVSGRPIQPAAVDDEFYFGRGIESKGKALLAAETGVLRRGWNWVEVLPFKVHDWSLELSKDKNTCYLNFNPGGTESSAPDPAEILKRAQMLGCSEDSLIDEARLLEIINTSVHSGRELKQAVLSNDDDGFFEIKVSEDKLKAEMVMHKGRGEGKPLVLKQAGAAIKASGLKSLDLKKIQDIILEFYRGPESDITFDLSEGTPAENGETGDIVYELEFMKEQAAEEIKKRAPHLDDAYLSAFESAKTFPPAEASHLATVQAEQKIALLPASEGKKGTDVYGNEIASVAADLSSVKALENIKIEEGVISSETKGLLERFDREGVTAFRIRPHMDSEFRVSLSSDGMTALLSAEPAIGTGAPPSIEEANRVIAEAGVTNGIDSEAIRRVVDKCRDGESVIGEEIAAGKEPVNAGDAELNFLISLASGDAVTIDEKGRANYRKQNKLTNVKEGDRIAEVKVVQGESEDGWDVCGRVLPAKKTSPVDLEIGANLKEETVEDGTTVIIAEKSGRVIYENNRLEIQENLFIKGDVDFNSGNIKFGGDVNVKGNVKSGFFVMAGGNINVGMNSEMSLLSAEKSIMVAQGIKGGGKAILRSKESIQLSFAERATLLAVEDISVKNAIFGCKVKCNGKLRLVTEKGYLVGGRIQAREGIEAANIGSISGNRTEISFGQDYLIADRIETEEREINKIKARLVKIDPEMKLLEKDRKKKELTKLRMEKVKLMKIMEKRSMRVFTLKERFEQHFPGEVLVRGEVFPGTVFESHGRTLEITKVEKSVRIVFNQETGMLQIVPVTSGG